MNEQELIKFTYNDYRYDEDGLTKLMKDINTTLMRMEQLRDEHGIALEQTIADLLTIRNAMTKAWFMIQDK